MLLFATKILLPLWALIMLVMGVFSAKTKYIYRLSLVGIALVAVSVYIMKDILGIPFQTDLVVSMAILAMGAGILLFQPTMVIQFEFYVLYLMAVAGMVLMVLSNDFLTLFMGIELQALSFYVLVASKKEDPKATEAALKYFILGTFATCLFLYGTSLIYGSTGAIGFAGIGEWIQVHKSLLISNQIRTETWLLVGLSFVIAAMAFKLALVPFHSWAPDVYDGATTSVTLFIATLPKIAAFYVLVKILFGPFMHLRTHWQDLIIILSLCSITWGSFAALQQTRMKRFVAYSTISNMGFALLGLVAGGEHGIQASLFYITIYVVLTYGFFLTFLLLKKTGFPIHEIDNYKGLIRREPQLAASLCFFLFSMSGVPPLIGFMSKYLVFKSIVQEKMYILALIAVVVSVITAAYYLRVIGFILFNESTVQFSKKDVLVKDWRRLLLPILVVALIVTFIFPGLLMTQLGAIAKSLMGGAV